MEDHLTPPELLDGKNSRYELLIDSSDEEIVPPANAPPTTGTCVSTVRGHICSFGKTPQLAAVDFPVLQDDEESQESIYDDMPALEYVCYSNSDTDEDYDVEYSQHPFNSDKDRNDASIPVNYRLTCKLCPRYFSMFKYFPLHLYWHYDLLANPQDTAKSSDSSEDIHILSSADDIVT